MSRHYSVGLGRNDPTTRDITGRGVTNTVTSGTPLDLESGSGRHYSVRWGHLTGVSGSLLTPECVGGPLILRRQGKGLTVSQSVPDDFVF